MNLFVDTSNFKLILILEKNNVIIDSLVKDNQLKISDIAIDEIINFLNKNNLTIRDIKNFYASKGPGSYTGVRVAITIIKTLKVINNNINVYLISSLAFQAQNKKAISIIDAKGDKLYLGIYNNSKNIVEDQLIYKNYLDDFKIDFKDYELICDFNIKDFSNAFLQTKKSFVKIDSVDDINPLYIKNFI